jgi:hypothetical protein
MSSLIDAEPYGDCLTHAHGHYEVWEAWARRSPFRDVRPDTFRLHPYEHFPRGRVVYHRPDQTFWIYADGRVQTPQKIAEVVRVFGLEGATYEVRSDPHYR